MPPRSDQRKVGDGCYQAQHGQQRKLTVSVTVMKGSSVTTCLSSLCDHRVSPDVSGLASLLGVGDRDHLVAIDEVVANLDGTDAAPKAHFAFNRQGRPPVVQEAIK